MEMEVIIKGEKRKRQVAFVDTTKPIFEQLVPALLPNESFVRTCTGQVHIIQMAYNPVREAKYAPEDKPWGVLP